MATSNPGSDDEIKWLFRMKRKKIVGEDIPLDPKVREMFYLYELCGFYREELRTIANSAKMSEICNRYVYFISYLMVFSLVSFVLGEPKRKISRLRRLSLKSKSKRSNSIDHHNSESSPPQSPQKTVLEISSSIEEVKPPTSPIQSPRYDIRYQPFDTDSERTGFELLPEEITFHVFSYLDITSTIRCGCVCKQWNEVIKKKNTERIEYLKSNYQKKRHGDPFLPSFKGYNRWTLFKGISDVKEALTKPDQVLKSRRSSRDIDLELRQMKKAEDGAVTLLLEGRQAS
jgi:hypothetical protein